MASGTISSRLQLDGEREYQQALRSAYTQLRVLRSELRAETAELGRNASQQDKARTKQENLRKQIAQQQQVVATLTQALADAREEYAGNEEVQASWEDRLNRARESLANMQNQLDECSESLEDFGNATNTVAQDSDKGVQAVVDLGDAMQGLVDVAKGIGDDIKGVFDTMLENIKSVVESISEMITQAYTEASNWSALASQWGVKDATKVEELMLGARFTQGVDESTVTSAVDKLNQSYGKQSSSTDFATLMAAYGLSPDAAFSEQFPDIMDLFGYLTEHANDNEATRGAWTNFFDDPAMLNILNNWGAIGQNHQTNVEDAGLSFSAEEIANLTLISQNMETIANSWQLIKEKAGSTLASVLGLDTISQDVIDVLRVIGKLMSGEYDSNTMKIELSTTLDTLAADISAGLDNLWAFISELTSMSDAFKESDNPLVRMLGYLLDILQKVATWLDANWDRLVSLMEDLLPTITANEGTKLLTGKSIFEWGESLFGNGLKIAELGLLGKLLHGGASGGSNLGGSGLLTGISDAFSSAGSSGFFSSLQSIGSSILNGMISTGADLGVGGGPVGTWFTDYSQIGRLVTGKQTAEEYGNYWSENWNDFISQFGLSSTDDDALMPANEEWLKRIGVEPFKLSDSFFFGNERSDTLDAFFNDRLERYFNQQLNNGGLNRSSDSGADYDGMARAFKNAAGNITANITLTMDGDVIDRKIGEKLSRYYQ